MSNVKISQLDPYIPDSQDGYGNVWIPCVKESGDTLIAAKYNLGELGDDLKKIYSAAIGESDILEFNPTNNYYPGQFVRYTDPGTLEVGIYKFVDTHLASPWTGTDATKTSVYTELMNIMTSDTETIEFLAITEDNGLPVVGKNITVSFINGDGDINLTTNSEGKASCTIGKGIVFSAKMSATINGYNQPNTFTGIKTALNKRYITFKYPKKIEGYCTITVQAILPAGKEVSDLTENTVAIFPENNEHDSFASGSLNSSGQVIFENIPKGQAYKVCGTSIGYATQNIPILPKDDMTVNIEYKETITTDTIYVVDSNFREVPMSAFLDANGNISTIYTQGLYSIASWKAGYLHVCVDSIASKGADYYVRLSDLGAVGNAWITRAWCTNDGGSYKTLPNVVTSTTELNGKLMTFWMAYDARDTSSGGYSEVSKAAEYANSQTITYIDPNNSGTSEILHGYIGTRAQMSPLYTEEMSTNVYKVLNAVGYPCDKSVTSTSATNPGPGYYNRTTWSSSQFSQTRAWGWTGASHDWSNGSKTYAYGVLPVFSR